MRYLLEALVHRCEKKSISVKCIPTSYQSKQLLYDYKLPLTEIQFNPEIAVTIDGADEVDANLVAIKGGGGCHFQEKIIASAAKKFVVVADYRKNSVHLGEQWTEGISIEVLPSACEAVRLNLRSMSNVPLDEIVIRIGTGKVGPVITDNGNFILDWKFNSDTTMNYSVSDWRTEAEKVNFFQTLNLHFRRHPSSLS